MNIIPFHFHSDEVRVIDQNGEPWFVARDIAFLLGYSNPQKAVRDHCKSATPVGVNESFTLDQQTAIIPERDVYRLIMRSKKPEAEAFEEWVVGEVLPSIRKRGSYTLGKPEDLSKMDVLKLALESEEQRLKLEGEKQHLVTQLEAAAPKVAFAERVEVSPDAISVAQAAKIIGTGQRRLFDFLRSSGWISRRNEPYQQKIEQGLLNVKLGSFHHPEQGLKQSVTTVVTGKGLTKLKQIWDAQHSQLH
ncbi:phage antirepressor KilAC domain-containing protein [Marinomonas transparens]|uniref:Phage antirepressor n=1 Tax=Marinomonas transparens TaxID=2795388 RepID=A0A934MY50_9GAMM|nr:phage antirepressor [Marinomonas transparens]MBJ7540039.1 phage antirepressor [Marinomonas transparens]